METQVRTAQGASSKACAGALCESALLDCSEIVIDNFAGGGGASTGIEAAIGRHVDYAVNHNAKALALHAANHPPLHTITTKDRFAIVMVRGEPHYIADIGMRGLVPRELARATSFDDSYVLDAVHDGKRLSKTDQVWMLGNAVPPKMAEALVRANFQRQTE